MQCLFVEACIADSPYGIERYYDSSLDLKRFILTQSRLDWFQQQFASWNDFYQPVFAQIRTQHGMGFTFNMIDADKLLNFKS